MLQITVRDAERNFARLISMVRRGEEVIIEENGVPIARLVATSTTLPPRQPDRDRGRFIVPDDFDEPLPDEIVDQFYQ